MTETEWLDCADPERMLSFLGGTASERKLRLFAVGCCQRHKERLDHEARELLDLVERYTEGLAFSNELNQQTTWFLSRIGSPCGTNHLSWAVVDTANREASHGVSKALYNIAHSYTAREFLLMHGLEEDEQELEALIQQEQRAQCELVREMFGDPFCGVSFANNWRNHGNGFVEKFAQHVYQEQAFEDLPILADALEEAGCDHQKVLEHCREDRSHARGCWVLDLLLGKE